MSEIEKTVFEREVTPVQAAAAGAIVGALVGLAVLVLGGGFPLGLVAGGAAIGHFWCRLALRYGRMEESRRAALEPVREPRPVEPGSWREAETVEEKPR